jgi:hypothetical protein
VSFLVKLFAIKGNLVVMNHLYHKLAVASVCTALSFTLVANKEAKAATITLESTLGFYAADSNRDGRGDWSFDFAAIPSLPINLGVFPGRYTETVEYRPLYEFNIANLFLTSNTIVTHAIFQVRRDDRFSRLNPNDQVSLFGYKGNGKDDASDFQAGTYLSNSKGLHFFRFDVTPFVNVIVNNNDAFAGFGLRAEGFRGDLDTKASLIIETADVAEPVPEPTTIFGSVIALGVGGWLKRKKSSQQNKTAL